MSSPGTVLVVGSSFGSGHLQAAQNVTTAISSLQPTWKVNCLDALGFLAPPMASMAERLWRFASCHLGGLYGILYRQAIRGERSRGWIRKVAGDAAERVLTRFSGEPISLFVATHSLAAAIGSAVKARVQCKLCVVATDFVLHSVQVFPNVDLFYTPPGCHLAIDPTQAAMVSSKMCVSGIPISPSFQITKDRGLLRTRLGLSPQRLTVLVSFGGDGLRADRHVGLFGALLDEGLPLQFLVLAGRNRAFAAAMQKTYARSRYARHVRVFGFVPDVSPLYSVADVLVGKAGGLTISEALAAELPVLVVDCLPGQEEFNVDLIRGRGLGERVHSYGSAAQWLRSFVERGITDSERQRLAHLARPQSSWTVAKHSVELAA